MTESLEQNYPIVEHRSLILFESYHNRPIFHMIYTVATSNVNNAVQRVSSRKQPFTKFKGSSRSSSSASPTTFKYFKGTAIFLLKFIWTGSSSRNLSAFM